MMKSERAYIVVDARGQYDSVWTDEIKCQQHIEHLNSGVAALFPECPMLPFRMDNPKTLMNSTSGTILMR